jgi:hypothetical protein
MIRWPFRARREPAGEPFAVRAPLPTQDIIRRGEAAQRLLSDPFLLAAFEDIKTEACRVFADTKPEAAEVREKAYLEIYGVELVRGRLRRYIAAAKMRAAEREQADRDDRAA